LNIYYEYKLVIIVVQGESMEVNNLGI